MKVKAIEYKNWQGTGMDITVVYNPDLDGPIENYPYNKIIELDNGIPDNTST